MAWWGKNILRGANVRLEKQKYTKYNKANNNSGNFKGARLVPGGIPSSCPYPPPLVVGLLLEEKFHQ